MGKVAGGDKASHDTSMSIPGVLASVPHGLEFNDVLCIALTLDRQRAS
jgi:hypothetical protein